MQDARQTAAGQEPVAPASIRLRVQHVNQLFHTLDPFPFRERDLDSGVEEFVVGSARELPGRGPLTVAVHMPAAQARQEAAADIGEGFRNYFGSREGVVGRELRTLLKVGQMSLLVGLAVLAASIAAGIAFSHAVPEGFLRRFVDDGLIIVGWVALWRPIDIFLFEWWPIVRKRRLYRRLSRAEVIVVPEAG